MPDARVVILPGDGIGPEITEAAVSVLEAAKVSLQFSSFPFGGAGIDAAKEPLPPSTWEACQAADAILLGAVGGPKWDGAPKRPESGLLSLRKGLELFANLRPVKPNPELAEESSPLRSDLVRGLDLIVVRELTGGIYFGQPRLRREENNETVAVDTCLYSQSEVRRIADLAFRIARTRRKRVCSVDKANVLETSRLWREEVTKVHADYEDVSLEHQLVDSAAMRLITHAREYDVILTGNMFGDILSDESSVLTGSIGLLPSASLGSGRMGLYEPIHGSAPDIAGQQKANPIGTILSAAMMLRHSLERPRDAARIEAAVDNALKGGARTTDIGGTLSTRDMTRAIIEALESESR